MVTVETHAFNFYQVRMSVNSKLKSLQDFFPFLPPPLIPQADERR